MRLSARMCELRCAVCHDALEGASWDCPRCRTRLHAECRESSPRCPTLGCGSRPAVVLHAAREERWSFGPGTLVLAALSSFLGIIPCAVVADELTHGGDWFPFATFFLSVLSTATVSIGVPAATGFAWAMLMRGLRILWRAVRAGVDRSTAEGEAVPG